jgi:hypothetical protein
MKNHVKSFGHFVNESELPSLFSDKKNQITKEFEELSPKEQNRYRYLVNELKKMGMIEVVAKNFAKYDNLYDILDAMESLVSQGDSKNTFGSFKDSNYWVSKDTDSVYHGDFDDYEDEEHADWDSLHSKYGKNSWFGDKSVFDRYQKHSKGAPFIVRRRR